MPAPSLTSRDQIVSMARQILEREGVDGLTMQKVARSVGVRAPSLYKHISGRAELMRSIIESVTADLGDALSAAADGEDAVSDLSEIARAFRAFAQSHPESYRLLFAPMPEEWRPGQEVALTAVDVVIRTCSALTGPERALDGARLLTSWAHGFVSMELAGAFRMEGDVDEAFAFGVEQVTEALSSVGMSKTEG